MQNRSTQPGDKKIQPAATLTSSALPGKKNTGLATLTATKSQTIFNLKHKCFLFVINNGNCTVTAINSHNCQAFYAQLSS